MKLAPEQKLYFLIEKNSRDVFPWANPDTFKQLMFIKFFVPFFFFF